MSICCGLSLRLESESCLYTSVHGKGRSIYQSVDISCGALWMLQQSAAGGSLMGWTPWPYPMTSVLALGSTGLDSRVLTQGGPDPGSPDPRVALTHV